MVLVKARPGQEPQVRHQLSRDPFYNLFSLSNLNEGLSSHLEVWTDGKGTLMRWHEFWTIDAGPDPEQFPFAEAAAIVDQYEPERVQGLVGHPDSVEPLVSGLRRHSSRVYSQTLSAMQTPPPPMGYSGSPRPARPEDLERLVEIYADAEILTRSRHLVERAFPDIWVVEKAGEIVACASIPGKTEETAMIGAVFTLPQYRGQGYASTLVHAMCTELLNSGRKPCLFYMSPDAARIYHRLGFRDIGPWRLTKFPRQQS